jgi:hypothetical protein
MRQLTAGWVTCIIAAADFMLPVTITARNASICLGLSSAPQRLMERQQHDIFGTPYAKNSI